MTVRKPKRIDPRVRRSINALGAALVALIQERDFGSITVQDILNRAGVGRATFYAHYRNKDDVLYSGYERLFQRLQEMLDLSPSSRTRLAPVAEFLTHLGEPAAGFVEGLRVSGKLDDMSALGTGFMARMIEQRIAPVPGAVPLVPPSLVARMLAAALMEMVRWWLDHHPRPTPAQMDATFHALAGNALNHASYVLRRGPA